MVLVAILRIAGLRLNSYMLCLWAIVLYRMVGCFISPSCLNAVGLGIDLP